RHIWTRMFSALPSGARIYVNLTFQDILTLWFTLAAAILLLPLLPGANLRAGTTVEALERLRLPAGIARVLALALIAASATLLVGAVGLALSVLQSSAIVMPGGEAVRSWLQNQGLWFGMALGIASVLLLLFAYFMLSPRLASVELSIEEKRDLRTVSFI